MNDEKLFKLAIDYRIQGNIDDLKKLANHLLQEAINQCEMYENHIEGLRDKTYNAELAGRQIGAFRCAQLIRSLFI